MIKNSNKQSDCPNLCGGDKQKYLSQGVNGDIYWCKKCLLVWSELTWQKDRDLIVSNQVESEEKARINRTKQKSKIRRK